ncbi:hypothetical protein [Nocardia sp. NPDC004123]
MYSIWFDAQQLDAAALAGNAELQGTIPMWQWIGDDPAVRFSY